ncbi:MAG: preprotein translocase subunit SecA [Candidatus Aenigmarchaeota archaeon]|nr:preprotein translocase subunit SecA [Candidatus Aenigmarchaeota archaeon]
MGLLDRILGDPNDIELRRLQPIVGEINSLEPDYKILLLNRLIEKTQEFKHRLQDGQSFDKVLPHSFAAVREASKRTIGMRHFDVQLMGGIVLHQGDIAEMANGEGKTLVATLPAYLNALTGKGVHVVTVNDYLARRDCRWMGPIYDSLGLSVGVIQQGSAFMFDPNFISPDGSFRHLRPVSRREAYESDITYGTNHEFGFDYLRDNMILDLSQCVQRGLNYAIVDEVDSILIDEARTPLIISGPAEDPSKLYRFFASLIPTLRGDTDYVIDEKSRIVTLTENGISELEKLLRIENLYSPQHYHLIPYIQQVLTAETLYRKDVDYIVKDGQVIIVDESTGRLMHDRRYSEGLHQAIEAKEGVAIQRESLTLATITLQNYFRMYDKLAGMSGTAATDAEEFSKIYGMDVVVIPTNKPVIKIDNPDVVYKSERAKLDAIVREVEECRKIGRPALIGTRSIEKSEKLAEMLRRNGIQPNVLNAKYHEKEARIVAQAGRPYAVTVATNMAGRGTDIKLGGDPEGLTDEYFRRTGVNPTLVPKEQYDAVFSMMKEGCEQDRERVMGLGGLHVIGTERHEARRIDNQLRGRAGRQGDPGSSRFYLSLEDELMERFGGKRVADLMSRLGLEEDIPIEHRLVTKSIENAQTRVEGYNFDIRKHVLEYDDVVNKQREVIYGQRRKVLSNGDLKQTVLDLVNDEIYEIVDVYYQQEGGLTSILNRVGRIYPLRISTDNLDRLRQLNPDILKRELLQKAKEVYEIKEQGLGEEEMRQIEKLVMLKAVDSLWIRHLTALDELREGIGLRAYGQQDPLVEYQKEAYRMFQELMGAIKRDVVHSINTTLAL